MLWHPCLFFFFFFNDTATTEIYTLSLHDALPIFPVSAEVRAQLVGHSGDFVNLKIPDGVNGQTQAVIRQAIRGDRKSTRLNSSHSQKSYAVFCFKKKKK